jgi:hypothetical protein
MIVLAWVVFIISIPISLYALVSSWRELNFKNYGYWLLAAWSFLFSGSYIWGWF